MSKTTTNKGFVKSKKNLGGTHWTQFIVKGKTLSYFDSPGDPLYTFLIELPKPIFFPISNIQDKNSELCGKYSLYVFYQIERMDHYEAVLKTPISVNCVW